MINNLKETELKFIQLESRLGDPDVVSDMEKYRTLMKEYKALSPIVEKYREFTSFDSAEKEAAEMLSLENDEEMKKMCEEEIRHSKEEKERCLEELKVLLLPKDPDDDKNVVIEIRAGAGGEEAALFSGVLFRMYCMYAASCGWKAEVVEANETELGGYKEVSLLIEGENAFSKLKYESGVHRVQRIPETESQGRIQTSTVTVAVLPEAEEVEVEINQQDLEIDTHRASGAGGQHINKTDSAIRILHKPTGIVVECQDERSQLKNREKAMKVLRAKLYEKELEKKNAEISSARRSQIGSGDRSERIRTYNYPQSRVTDHRIGLSLHSLESILNGRIDELIEALATAERMQKLQEQSAQ